MLWKGLPSSPQISQVQKWKECAYHISVVLRIAARSTLLWLTHSFHFLTCTNRTQIQNQEKKSKKKLKKMLLLLCDTLTFRQAYPTFRHGCRSNNSNNSDQKYQIKKKKKNPNHPKIQKKTKCKIPNSKIPNPKSQISLISVEDFPTFRISGHEGRDRK